MHGMREMQCWTGNSLLLYVHINLNCQSCHGVVCISYRLLINAHKLNVSEPSHAAPGQMKGSNPVINFIKDGMFMCMSGLILWSRAWLETAKTCRMWRAMRIRLELQNTAYTQRLFAARQQQLLAVCPCASRFASRSCLTLVTFIYPNSKLLHLQHQPAVDPPWLRQQHLTCRYADVLYILLSQASLAISNIENILFHSFCLFFRHMQEVCTLILEALRSMQQYNSKAEPDIDLLLERLQCDDPYHKQMITLKVKSKLVFRSFTAAP